jgi:hypothetical protein
LAVKDFSMSLQIGSSGNDGAPVSSPPSLGSLPEVLSDRATGGSLTLPEAVAFIQHEYGTRVHRATLWRWVLSGKLAAYRVGGKVKTTRRAVLAMLEADAQGCACARRRRRDEAEDEVARAGAEAAARIAGQGGA